MSCTITLQPRAERASEVGAGGEGLAGQQKQPERQRGRWNFLTWSFFLAEVATGAQLLTTGAKAQENADPKFSTTHGEANAIHDGVSGNLGSAAMSADDGATAAPTGQIKASVAEGALSLLDLQHGGEPGEFIGEAGEGGAGAAGSGSSGGGSGSGSQADSGGPPSGSDDPPPGELPPIADGPPPGNFDPPSGSFWPPTSDSDPLPGAPNGDDPSSGLLPPISVGGTVSLLLETSLDQLTGVVDTTLDQLTGVLDHTLDHLAKLPVVEAIGGFIGETVDGTLGQLTGLVGTVGEMTAVIGSGVDSSLNDLSAATGNTLSTLTGDLTDALNNSNLVAPALTIVPDLLEIAPLEQGQDISTGGTFSFPDATSATVLQIDDLFTGGRYTDYGLAVQTTDTAGATAIVSPLSGDLADIITLNVPLDSPADGHESASHVALPSNIDELGVRDLLG
jgi:hypothetical protein